MIVCAIDTSSRAPAVADAARRLAGALGRPLVRTHVFDPDMVPVAPSRELHRVETTEAIEERERRIARAGLDAAGGPRGGVQETAVFAEGAPLPEILRVLDEHDARLLVVGSKGRRPLERIMQGSTAADLVREAPCAVVVVPDDARPAGDGPVLVGYDGSEDSLRAARHGARLATVLGRALELVHVVAPGDPHPRPDDELLDELRAAARAGASAASAPAVDIAVAVEHGDPVDRLLHEAQVRHAALVCVGNRGRSSLTAAVLGSVSAGVVRRADRWVLVAGPRSEQRFV